MDRDKLGATLLGMTIVGLVYVNIKFNKRTELLRDAVYGVGEVVDTMFQAEIDQRFAEIVENYEE